MKKVALNFSILLLLQFPSFAPAGELVLSTEFTIVGQVAPANSDEMVPGKPGIAFDGTNYLVVTCREDVSSDYITGVLVSSAGLTVDSFPISSVNAVYGCAGRSPSVAFDGTNYLVVFSQVTSTGSSDIVGVRIAPNGSVLDESPGITILPNVVGGADVAFDGSNYLVVASRYSDETLHDIFGARFTPDGLVLEEFPIFTAFGGQVMASVAFDGSNYFVVWSDTRNGSPVGPDADIYGTRVTPEGVVLDLGGIEISTAVGAQAYPEIIFNGDNYFAVWDDRRNDTGVFPSISDIYGTRITSEGLLLDGPSDTGGIAIATYPLPKTRPSVSFDGKYYLVTWEMSFFYDPPAGIYAARVSSDGVLMDGPPSSGGLLISEPSYYGSKLIWPNSLYNGDNTLITWVNTGTTKDVIGVLAKSIGGLIEVQIDFDPYSTKNILNTKSSSAKYVAIFGSENLDVAFVDVASIKLSGASVRLVGKKQTAKCNLVALNADSYIDLVCQFSTGDIIIEPGMTIVELTAQTYDGDTIVGYDTVQIR